MTATYTGNPAGRDIDRVRLLVGDTDMTDALLQDEEIAFAISQDDDIYKASAIAARMIASKLSRSVSEVKFDDVSQKFTSPTEQYLKLATTLESQAKTVSTKVSLGLSAGGLSVAEMTAVRENPDRVPGFWDGQFDAPPTSGVRK